MTDTISELTRAAAALLSRIEARTAVVGIIGLGYVGLPLAVAIARAGYRSIGFDVDVKKPPMLNAGHSYIGAVQSDELLELTRARRFTATSEMGNLTECDFIIICVPTPLTRYREPDLSHVEATSRTVAKHLRFGQVIVLESTTYPGTTEGVVRPILEAEGLKSGDDFLLGFSPEREDPGNCQFHTVTIPRVVSGDGPMALQVISAFYASVVEEVIPVSSPSVAEAVKITENIFRAVNIALVNELKVVYDAMGINVWEVIDAAKTKPFGYMPFYPGPGLGGHCIPIDPFYLTWKSREFEVPTRFIELAGEINASMPRYVVRRLEESLDIRLGLSLSKAKILVLGIAYKRNVSDVRESPAFKFMELIEERGGTCDYTDPHVPVIPKTREHVRYEGRRSVQLSERMEPPYDAAVVLTDHDAFDYGTVLKVARLIIDTRNVFARTGHRASHIVLA